MGVWLTQTQDGSGSCSQLPKSTRGVFRSFKRSLPGRCSDAILERDRRAVVVGEIGRRRRINRCNRTGRSNRILLRDHVGPALRQRGYKGSSGHYHRAVGDHRVAIRFQKSKWSTKEVGSSIRSTFHGSTPRSDRDVQPSANVEARGARARSTRQRLPGAWSAQFPGDIRPAERHWISIRPADNLPLQSTEQLMDDLDRSVFPEIQRAGSSCLLTPPPPLPSERPGSGQAETPQRCLAHWRYRDDDVPDEPQSLTELPLSLIAGTATTIDQ